MLSSMSVYHFKLILSSIIYVVTLLQKQQFYRSTVLKKNPTRMRSAWCSSKETIFGRSDCVMETTVTISRAHKQKLKTSHVDQQKIRLANIIEMLRLVE